MKTMISILLIGLLSFGVHTADAVYASFINVPAENAEKKATEVSETKTPEVKAAVYSCKINGCTLTTEHSHSVCGLEACTETGNHTHDGIYYLAHHEGDGHSYHQAKITCDVSGCTQTDTHTHEVCPNTDCTDTENHTHDGILYYGHYEGDSHDHAKADTSQQTDNQPATGVVNTVVTQPVAVPPTCGYEGCTITGDHVHGACGIGGCTQVGDHSHQTCGVAGCGITGDHAHGACGVGGCTQVGDHSHQGSGGGHHGRHGGGHH